MPCCVLILVLGLEFFGSSATIRGEDKLAPGAKEIDLKERRPYEEPPETVPSPRLRASSAKGANEKQEQVGQLLMSYWVSEDIPFILEDSPPYHWPEPLPMPRDDNAVVIDLNTTVHPIELEARVFGEVDANGVPTAPGAESWCVETPLSQDCVLTQDPLTKIWLITLRLPPSNGRQFISVRGSWYVSKSSSIRQVTDWITLDAGWFFSVCNGGSGLATPESNNCHVKS